VFTDGGLSSLNLELVSALASCYTYGSRTVEQAPQRLEGLGQPASTVRAAALSPGRFCAVARRVFGQRDCAACKGVPKEGRNGDCLRSGWWRAAPRRAFIRRNSSAAAPKQWHPETR